MTSAQGAYQHWSCLSIHSRARFLRRGGGAGRPLYRERMRSLQRQKFLISPCPSATTGGQLPAPGQRAAPQPPRLVPSRPGRRRGPSPAGRSRSCAAAAAGGGRAGGRPAAGGCAPVCVQSARAGRAPSRAATRKQTRGDSSAPSALAQRPPPAPLRAPASPPARPPGRPSPRPARLAPPPPRPAPAGAAPSPTAPRARSLAHHAPRAARPPGSWPLESEVRALRGDPAAAVRGAARGSFRRRGWPPGWGRPRLRASPARRRRRPGSRGSQVAQADLGAGWRAARRDWARGARGGARRNFLPSEGFLPAAAAAPPPERPAPGLKGDREMCLKKLTQLVTLAAS